MYITRRIEEVMAKKPWDGSLTQFELLKLNVEERARILAARKEFLLMEEEAFSSLGFDHDPFLDYKEEP